MNDSADQVESSKEAPPPHTAKAILECHDSISDCRYGPYGISGVSLCCALYRYLRARSVGCCPLRRGDYQFRFVE
jgi:hypothetical protein